MSRHGRSAMPCAGLSPARRSSTGPATSASWRCSTPARPPRAGCSARSRTDCARSSPTAKPPHQRSDMPTYLTPGVYVEEVPAQSKPIEGVGTSTAAFIGLAPGGPVNMPMRISNWTQFARIFADVNEPDNGPFMAGAYLAHAVYGFFQNGGGLCWVVRVGTDDGAPARQAALPAAVDPGREAFRAVAVAGIEGPVAVDVAEEA